MRHAWVLALGLLLGVPTANAGTDTTNTVTVPGSAVLEVAPDRLVIVFELAVERRTFAEAANGARAMASALDGLDVQTSNVTVSVSYDVTFMKQKSWGRGRKLDHRFEMTVDGVPEGEAQELMVELIDKSLELNNALTVESFEAGLSEGREQATRKRLLEQAVVDARSNAEVVANALGLQVGSPLSISVGGTNPLALAPGVAEMNAFLPNRFYQRSFAVDATLPSRIRQSATVVAEFALE